MESNIPKIDQIRMVAKFEGIELPQSDDAEQLTKIVTDHYTEVMRQQGIKMLERALYGSYGRPLFSGYFPRIREPMHQHPGSFIVKGAVS